MKKIFQIVSIIEIDNQIRSNFDFKLGNSKEEVMTPYGEWVNDDNTEVFAMEVCEETVEDYISHCRELIDYWRLKDDKHKNIIISRLSNLIILYEDLLREVG